MRAIWVLPHPALALQVQANQHRGMLRNDDWRSLTHAAWAAFNTWTQFSTSRRKPAKGGRERSPSESPAVPFSLKLCCTPASLESCHDWLLHSEFKQKKDLWSFEKEKMPWTIWVGVHMPLSGLGESLAVGSRFPFNFSSLPLIWVNPFLLLIAILIAALCRLPQTTPHPFS